MWRAGWSQPEVPDVHELCVSPTEELVSATVSLEQLIAAPRKKKTPPLIQLPIGTLWRPGPGDLPESGEAPFDTHSFSVFLCFACSDIQ